jgi:Zn finger protein HypA/HybF involved in hydrogenase expression
MLDIWDYQKNDAIGLHADGITSGADKVAWWLCPTCGSSYDMEVYRIKAGRGCPYCAGKRVNTTNSLVDNYPDIAATYASDNTIDVHLLTYGSSKSCLWVCGKYGHVYKKTVKARVHGQGCPYCAASNTTLLTGFNDFSTLHPELLKDWEYNKNKKSPSEYVHGSKKSVWWKCRQCGHEWRTAIDNRARCHSGCPSCAMHTSKAEQEMTAFIASILPAGTTVLADDRTAITPKELDCYIPEKYMAFEFNGLYWHGSNHLTSSGINARTYHHDKWLACRKKGIQLITIWEDDWQDHQDIVKSMIAYKLGVSQEKRVYARNTSFIQPTSNDVKDFMEYNHIQGYCSGSIKYGMLDDHDNMVACAIFRRRNDQVLELVRYASSCSVIGGLGRILHHVITDHPNCHHIVTFSDHMVSNGNMYEKLGFHNDGEIRPDYMYVINGHRAHKFGYRLKRFRNDPDLLYKDGMSESQLAAWNNIDRVYDAGKTRWVLDIGTDSSHSAN